MKILNFFGKVFLLIFICVNCWAGDYVSDPEIINAYELNGNLKPSIGTGDLIPNATPTFTTGFEGQGLAISQANQTDPYLPASVMATLAGKSEYTIITYVNASDFGNNLVPIFGEREAFGNYLRFFWSPVATCNTNSLYIMPQGNISECTNQPSIDSSLRQANTWYRYHLTFKNTAGVKEYKGYIAAGNGGVTLYKTSSNTTIDLINLGYTTNNNWALQWGKYTGAYQHATEVIDKIIIYNKVTLTAVDTSIKYVDGVQVFRKEDMYYYKK